MRIDSKRPTVVAWAASGPPYRHARLRYRVDDFVPGCGWAWMQVRVLGALGEVLTRSRTRPVTTNAGHTVGISTGRLGPGVYTVVLQATDAAGNVQRGWTRTTLTVR